MKKIYNFINGTESLHLYGTYEQVSFKDPDVKLVNCLFNLIFLRVRRRRVVRLWERKMESWQGRCKGVAREGNGRRLDGPP